MSLQPSELMWITMELSADYSNLTFSKKKVGALPTFFYTYYVETGSICYKANSNINSITPLHFPLEILLFKSITNLFFL